MKNLTALFFILTSTLSYGQVVVRSGGGSTGGHGKPKQEAPLPLYGNDNFIEESRDIPKSDIWNAFAEQAGLHKDNPLELSDDQSSFWMNDPIIVIEDYKSFLNNENVDGNIYSLYLDSRKDIIDEITLKTLLNFWQTDLNTPALYLQYQSSDGFDWNAIENHIREALEGSDESMIENMQNDSMFRFGDRIYINPYKNDIEGILKYNNSLVDMERIRRNLSSPSMVDFEESKIQIIIEGKEMSLEDVKGIDIKPFSQEIDNFKMK